MQKKIKIGLIGCGTIGSEIAKAIDRDFKVQASLVAISDIDIEKARSLAKKLENKPKVKDITGLIRSSDLVIEAASAKISGDIAKKAISAKKDVMVMSVGGIIKNYASLFTAARQNGAKVYVPSGAICGLDGVKAASLGKIYRAELTTRKPPSGLEGAPYVQKNNIDLKGITSQTMVFEGNAFEAIDGFPANINVACALSIAGLGPERTKVRIIADPESKKNIHEITVEGEFGRLITRTENVPSPNNPKTSYLAVLSAVATLKQILEPAKIGT